VRTAAAIALLVLFAGALAGLGVWQLRRADESRAIAGRFAAALDEPPLGRAPEALADEQRFHRLEVPGRYAPDRQFLLDNRVHDGVAGYEVLTPFALADDGGTLLVNRGWVPADPDRRVLPDVRVGSEPRVVRGRMERLPRPGLRLGASQPAAQEGPVAVVVFPTAAELATLAREPLLDYELLLEPDEPAGYVRDWRAPGLAPERHLAYAGQWFVFALCSLGGAVGLAVKARGAREEADA
jgi:surfeit locus 1 family protein